MPSVPSNLPSGQVLLDCPVKFLGLLYLLGQSLWLLTLGLDLWVWYLGLFLSISWGFYLRGFRLQLHRYSMIGLREGRWFIGKEEIPVCLNFDSVILPGVLLLNFQDESKKNYRFLIVPSMVLNNKENFSWLSRYAKLSPLF
jgi:hypothetical protein